jgi:hypothetical protein
MCSRAKWDGGRPIGIANAAIAVSDDGQKHRVKEMRGGE